MSGGVDSSAAAHLLLEEGHEVIGVFMRHGEATATACGSGEGDDGDSLLPIVTAKSHKQGCCTASDAEDARLVSHRLGIDFYALDLSQDFERIVDYFVEEYSIGRTPNPCVMCNNWIKFGKLFSYADGVGAEFVATGHYAQLTHEGGEVGLHRGLDESKDQSYVLFGIQREYLSRMLLPVGRFQKKEIRQMAGEAGLRVADKKDSQEICFVSPGEHPGLVASRKPDDRSGAIVTTEGQEVGRHEGIEGFTIGQRKGIGVALGEPRYVVEIRSGSKEVVIGTKNELARSTLTANRTNWLVDADKVPRNVMAQIRYNSRAEPASLEQFEDGRFALTFAEPCFGVAPGQAVVCYEGDRVLGGGWIE
jgi:tRNA-specific 2-thiouridylase